MSTPISKTKYTSQYIDNMSFDDDYKSSVSIPVAHDGFNLLRETTKQVAQKITAPDINTTYMAIAPIGSAQSDPVWQCKMVSVSGSDTVITWADGDANFDNISTDLTALTYL